MAQFYICLGRHTNYILYIYIYITSLSYICVCIYNIYTYVIYILTSLLSHLFRISSTCSVLFKGPCEKNFYFL